MNIGFIGTGNMAEAIIKGLLSQKIISSKKISGYDISSQRLKFLKKKYGINTTQDIAELVQDSKIILLSVKPQQMGEVLTQIAPILTKNHLIISIAAGLPLSFYLKILGKKIKMVRVMPNTPAMLALGASGFIATPQCKTGDKKIVHKLFSSVGLCLEVKSESLIDSITAISGSGPAYVYLFAQAMIQSGISLGLKPAQSKALVLQTLLGATHLLSQASDSPEELIKKVASKGGTTEAALAHFRSEHFEDIVFQAAKSAHDRSRELARILGE